MFRLVKSQSKKGHNSVNILQMLYEFERDLYFTMLTLIEIDSSFQIIDRKPDTDDDIKQRHEMSHDHASHETQISSPNHWRSSHYAVYAHA